MVVLTKEELDFIKIIAKDKETMDKMIANKLALKQEEYNRTHKKEIRYEKNLKKFNRR